MAHCFRLTCLLILVCVTAATAQHQSNPIFRLGGAVAFGLSHIASNNIGIGGMAGAEKFFSNRFAAELETSYIYITGDKVFYTEGKNKAFAAPLLAGIKAYPFSNVYASLRTGAVYFLLNHMPSARFTLGYGGAAGINLPEKNNRINLQIAYTGYGYEGISRGYTTLAAAIVIR